MTAIVHGIGGEVSQELCYIKGLLNFHTSPSMQIEMRVVLTLANHRLVALLPLSCDRSENSASDGGLDPWQKSFPPQLAILL